VAVALVVSGCSAATPSATPQPSAGPSAESLSPTASPSPTNWPTIAPSPATVPSQLDLATIGFWTFEQPFAAVDLSLNYLRVGTLDGHVTRTVDLHNPGNGPISLPLQPQPVGPAGGRMLYVADDGEHATLHAVSVASGADTELLTTSTFIPALALDPSGNTAYAVTLDRTNGIFVAVEAVATADGTARAIITIEDLSTDAATPYEPLSGISLYPRLAVSNDGRWIALVSCWPRGCDLIAAPADGSPLKHWQGFAFDAQIVGIAGDLLIGSGSCAEAFCDGFLIDLRTGVRWPLGGAGGNFNPIQLIAGPNGPLVLGQLDDYEAGHWQVEALDLTNRTRSITFAATHTPIDFTVRLAEWRQAELPVGWFLIYRNSTGAPSPEPDFSTGTIGGQAELPLPIMTIPRRDPG
jgi:hypothetical protein